MVARQVDKLKALSKQERGKPARKTPGVEKLLRLLVPHYLPNPNPNPKPNPTPKPNPKPKPIPNPNPNRNRNCNRNRNLTLTLTLALTCGGPCRLLGHAVEAEALARGFGRVVGSSTLLRGKPRGHAG